MSDMSRPSPSPTAAEHERHDPLLVAQFAAGDTLSPDRRVEAERLVATCHACAALAADLPLIARAVAREPVPPRRRDFRLQPEEAEQLRGNAVTRYLRRLSWPTSRAFQPAAAGLLSIGLLVVAGYAWPDGGTVTVQAEPNLVDWTAASPAADAADELFADPAAPLLVQPEDDAEAALDDAEAALDGAARLMEEPEFAESLVESQAGMAEGTAQKSSLEQDLIEPPDTPALELGAAADAAEQTVQGVDEDRSSVTGTRAAAVPGASPTEETATLASEVQVPADEGEPEQLLIVLGLVLALGGAGLLLLGWLARRARDPLAP